MDSYSFNGTHHNGTWDGNYDGNWSNSTWCNETNPYEPDYCWDEARSGEYSTGAIVGIVFGTLVMAILMSCLVFWCIGRFVPIDHDDEEAPSWWFDDVRASRALDYRGTKGEGDSEGIKLKERENVEDEKDVIESKNLADKKDVNESTAATNPTIASQMDIARKPIIENNPVKYDESKTSDSPQTAHDTRIADDSEIADDSKTASDSKTTSELKTSNKPIDIVVPNKDYSEKDSIN